jgi:hypothetical protein
MVIVDVLQYKKDVFPAGIQASSFKLAVSGALGDCGITVSFLFDENFDAVESDILAVQRFLPDVFLSVERKDFKSVESEGKEYFIVGMIDASSKKMLWRAELDVKAGAAKDGTLARMIVDRLKSDAVLGPACVTSGASRRTS